MLFKSYIKTRFEFIHSTFTTWATLKAVTEVHQPSQNCEFIYGPQALSQVLTSISFYMYDTESCGGRQRESMNIMIWSEFALSQQCNFAFFIRIYQSFTADRLLYFSMSIIYVIVSRFKAICTNVVFLDSLPMFRLHCGYRELNRRIWTNLPPSREDCFYESF